MFPLAQLAYVKGIRASAPKGEDMGEACMDTACRGAVLASKKQDVASKRVMVCVHVVDVDALPCHARRGHPPWDGQDAAMHLEEDKRCEKGWQSKMGATPTINCRHLRSPLRISGMWVLLAGIRGRIGSGGIG